ncbi:hypothetical protein SRRS_45000 [Sporomusa rhizae]
MKGSIGSFARKQAQLAAANCKLSHKTIYAQNFWLPTKKEIAGWWTGYGFSIPRLRSFFIFSGESCSFRLLFGYCQGDGVVDIKVF